MVDLSPKAARIVRLIADRHSVAAGRTQAAMLLEAEARFSAALARPHHARPRFIDLSEDTASYCLTVIDSLLDDRAPPSPELDDNDIEFARSVAASLRRQLRRPAVRSA